MERKNMLAMQFT